MLEKLFKFKHKYQIGRLFKTGIRIGENTLILNEAADFGYNPQRISIGSNCVVAPGVQFITSADITNRHADNRIVIHDNCFIGINSIINLNVEIGPDSIVGAGAVVMEDVPPHMCVSGNPSQVTCTVDIYRSLCSRGVIADYNPKEKRKLLTEHFWI